MAIGTVNDVIIQPPASRATDQRAIGNQLSSLSLTVKQNGVVSRQHRAGWIAMIAVPHPTSPVAAFALTPSAGYVQAEAQAAATKITELSSAIAVLQSKVDAIIQAADDNVVEIAEA